VYRAIVFSFLLSVLVSGVVIAEPASNVLGHKAVYSLKLLKAKDGASISAVDGRMVLEVTDACDGYTLHQRIVLGIYDSRGGMVTSDFRMTSWERADGTGLRFNTQEKVNGNEVQAFDGSVAMDNPDGSGTVTLNKPKSGTLALQSDTLFPTAHTMELVAHAERGKKLFSADVFDGSKGLGSLFATSAFIGTRFAAGDYEASHKGADLLAKDPSWSAQVAYFPYLEGGTKRGEIPEFEIGYRIFANGVVSDLQVDYGDFEVSGSLEELELLPDAGC
jgi:hypothetical protein